MVELYCEVTIGYNPRQGDAQRALHGGHGAHGWRVPRGPGTAVHLVVAVARGDTVILTENNSNDSKITVHA